MALWTPYVEDAVLDLSVKRKNEQSYTEVPYQFPNAVPQSVQYPNIYQPMLVPLAETSPISSCSGSASVSSARNGVISPPESPVSVDETKRPSYVMDVDTLSDDPDFQAFERDTLRSMAVKNGGTLLGNNPRMRRSVQTNQNADDSYRKQRERNNFAAKQSRDRRKLREIQLSIKVTYMKNELSKLKRMLASKTCIKCHQSCPC